MVVVTGGALGIGAGIADALSRGGAFVVVVDPGVTVDGRTPSDEAPAVTAGGQIRRSNASVTDAPAIEQLFGGLRDEFGRLDTVINVAGISRATGFAEGAEEDWAAVLHVHLDGYLNVLRAALPIMATAGHGRILGVTSGSGWRGANAGAYSCAKRAVAALTWQIGRVAPAGVTVNALSPIALTRMVTGARPPGAAALPPASTGATGGLSLAAMPAPEDIGPVGAYLAGEALAWCSGEVFFSNGSELARIVPPRVVEAVRSVDVASLARVLEAVIPAAFVSAEATQTTNGASNARFAGVFDEPATAEPTAQRGGRCVVITDDNEWEAPLRDALTSRGVTIAHIGAGNAVARDFAGASEQLVALARDAGPIDAFVVALSGAPTARGGTSGWEHVLDDHSGVADQILRDAAWIRAVADYSAEHARPVRVATVTDATTAGGRSRAQAAAQLARAAHVATDNRIDAFALSVETDHESRRQVAGELVAHLLDGADTAALSGAELVVASTWFGLRSHPHPEGTISFGGPAVPAWVDDLLHDMVPANPI